MFAKSAGVHPYLYRKRIDRFDAAARPGDLVAVRLDRRTVAGYGLFNPRAEITVRLLSSGPEPPGEAFWSERLARGRRSAARFARARRDHRRLSAVHSEGDGLSGIVVDRFGDVLSAEAFSLGMFQRRPTCSSGWPALAGTRAWILRPGPATFDQEAFEGPALQSEHAPSTVTIQDMAPVSACCSRRDTRRASSATSGRTAAGSPRTARGKSVLDLCCYTGGFAVQAKKLGNAAEVTGVDLDEGPLQLARENASLNQVRVNFVHGDVFAYMRDMLRNGRQYDVVVLDPPKLIRTRDEFDEGRRKHFDLNRLAIQLVRPGGLLLTCTCSGLLDEAEFLKLLARRPARRPSRRRPRRRPPTRRPHVPNPGEDGSRGRPSGRGELPRRRVPPRGLDAGALTSWRAVRRGGSAGRFFSRGCRTQFDDNRLEIARRPRLEPQQSRVDRMAEAQRSGVQRQAARMPGLGQKRPARTSVAVTGWPASDR